MRPKHEAGVHTSGEADVLVVTRMSKWEQPTETLGSLTISKPVVALRDNQPMSATMEMLSRPLRE